MKQTKAIEPAKVVVPTKSIVIPAYITQLGQAVVSNFSTVLLIVASFLIGMLWTEVRYLKAGGSLAGGTAPTTTTTAPTQQQVNLTMDQVKGLFTKDRIVFGDPNKAKILFVEVSDPSCPFCHIAGGKNPELNKASGGQFLMKADGGNYVPPVPEMKKLVDSGKAAFLWLYSPGHGSGEMGTKAMYCAYEKGKFWQVHDLLMSKAGYDLLNNTVKNDKAQIDTLADFLKSAMNPNDLKNCISAGKYDAKISEDYTLAQQIGYQGTPYFVINTKSFPGAYSFTDMEATVKSFE